MDNIHAAKWAIRGNPETVDFKDKRGRTPLFYAAAGGSFEVCKLLITKGAVIDTKGNLGRTPLHAACRHGHHRLVSLLFSTKQSLPGTSSVPFNAWHFASLSGSPETLRALRPYTSVFDLAKMIFRTRVTTTRLCLFISLARMALWNA
jgi:hypothetical protein